MTTTDRLDDHARTASQNTAVVEAPNLPAAHVRSVDQARFGGGGSNIQGDHRAADLHGRSVVLEQAPHPATPGASTTVVPPGGAQNSGGQRRIDTQGASAVAPNPPGPASSAPESKGAAPVLADPLLAIVADILDDLERVRIANENRYRQLTRHESDSDDEVRGFGLSPDNPAVQSVAKLVTATKLLELEAENNLKRMMRKHALGPWVKGLTGVGEKQAARLLAVVGDPTWHSRDDRPRSVSELRSYCGWGDARAQVRRRGEKANWSDTAKKRTWVIAESCMKQIKDPCKSTRPDGQVWAEHGDDCKCSPFRVVYDQARQKYEGSVHDIECRRCGPKGKPAEAGSPRSDGHVHAMSLRVVCKAILKSMWQEGRRLRGEADE